MLSRAVHLSGLYMFARLSAPILCLFVLDWNIIEDQISRELVVLVVYLLGWHYGLTSYRFDVYNYLFDLSFSSRLLHLKRMALRLTVETCRCRRTCQAVSLSTLERSNYCLALACQICRFFSTGCRPAASITLGGSLLRSALASSCSVKCVHVSCHAQHFDASSSTSNWFLRSFPIAITLLRPSFSRRDEARLVGSTSHLILIVWIWCIQNRTYAWCLCCISELNRESPVRGREHDGSTVAHMRSTRLDLDVWSE